MQESSRRLPPPLNSASHPCLLTDVDGKIVHANAAAETLFGYEAGALDGQSISVLLPPELKETHASLLTSYCVNPWSRPMDGTTPFRAVKRDGSALEVAIGLEPLGQPHPQSFIALIREWPGGTDELEAQRLAEVLKESPVMVARVDRDLRYQWIVNAHAPLTPAQCVGKRDDEIAAFEGMSEFLALKREVLATGKTARRRLPFHFEGDAREWDIVVTPRFAEAGEVVGLTTVAVDVSELSGLVENQRRLLAAVAHDLRNPLTVIRADAERLAREVESDSARDLVEQSSRMDRMVADLLDLCAVESGHLALHPEDVDLVAVADEAIFRARALSDRHVLYYVPPARPLPTGRWDSLRLGQVLDNLIGNAIKYSPNGGTVTVSVEDGGHEGRVSISDEGLGISSDEIPTIFGQFQRTATAVESGVPGFGLGLAIAKALVEAHGGILSVRSGGPGMGSTFSFTLPYAR